MTFPVALTVWALACGPSAPDYPVPGNRWSYEKAINQAADHALLSRFLGRAIAQVETTFDHTKVSWANARGLFQILKRDQAYLIKRYKIVGFKWGRPRDSATLGCLYLSDLIKRFQSEKHGVMAYNGGPSKLAKALGASEETGVLDLPRQTLEFWPKVLRASGRYR